MGPQRPMSVKGLTALLMFAAGCGGPVEVSPAARDLSMAAVQAVGRRSEEAVTRVAEVANERAAAGDITPSEMAEIAAVLELGRRGTWDEANEAARRLVGRQKVAPGSSP